MLRDTDAQEAFRGTLLGDSHGFQMPFEEYIGERTVRL